MAWAGMDTATMDLEGGRDAFDISGNPIAREDKSGTPVTAPKYSPTYLQHLTYFITYQLGYMYFRYLMWNFAGRQNDIPSTGESDHGNFITGYPLIDNLMLGDQSKLPPSAGKANPGHNVYYLLPFGLA